MTSIDERTGRVKLYNSKQEREVVEQYAGAHANREGVCNLTCLMSAAWHWHKCSDQAIPHCVRFTADLFAILKTTEKLERAWTRDLISAKEYEPLCAKLIAQFKTLWSTLRDSVHI